MILLDLPRGGPKSNRRFLLFKEVAAFLQREYTGSNASLRVLLSRTTLKEHQKGIVHLRTVHHTHVDVR